MFIACRVGNVLLSAWIAQSETATLSAAPAPAPAPLPEAVVEQQPQQAGEQATTNAKGFQQVTAWQVSCAAVPHTLQSAERQVLCPVPGLFTCCERPLEGHVCHVTRRQSAL